MDLRLNIETYWLILGFLGQILFFLRFFVQWLASEKEKKSVIPLSFWLFSLSGGIVLLVYAIHIKNPVFVAGQSCGIFIYIRNLLLLSKRNKNQ
ncbi:MAG: lipid-A-disaccharide synthase N-terminal domain-containing protein [Candidatus Omnitrophica bacterium]|nr:lipid-A-disaccharide synthase N-terminal domain-containing protein [Candidatus Omnitrophota bacterium]